MASMTPDNLDQSDTAEGHDMAVVTIFESSEDEGVDCKSKTEEPIKNRTTEPVRDENLFESGPYRNEEKLFFDTRSTSNQNIEGSLEADHIVKKLRLDLNKSSELEDDLDEAYDPQLKEPGVKSYFDVGSDVEIESEIDRTIHENDFNEIGTESQGYSSENDNVSQTSSHEADIGKIEPILKETNEQTEIDQTKDHSGILQKRRDVFRNQWRDRYFTLNAETGELSYYLIPRQAIKRKNRSNSRSYDLERILSFNKDMDPRGTISLHGSSVRILSDDLSRTNRQNNRLSPTRPNQKQRQRHNRFRFLITSPARDNPNSENKNKNHNVKHNENRILTYLAAPSEIERSIWVKKISTICNSSHMYYDFMMSSAMKTKISSNVSDPLVNKIQLMIRSSLQILYQGYISNRNVSPNISNNQSWKPLLQKDGVTALKRTQDNAFLIKSEVTLSHNMRDIFQLIWNIQRRPEYDSNVDAAKRVYTYNAHTFLDYYTSTPAGFSHASDFCVLTHWRVLSPISKRIESGMDDSNHTKSSDMGESQNSIIILSFSHDSHLCPENEPHFIRENLIFSVWLLEPVTTRSSMSDEIPTNRCRVRYATSIDFFDDLPSDAAESIIEQQALLPASLGQYLDGLSCKSEYGQKLKSVDENYGDNHEIISNEKLAEDIADIVIDGDNSVEGTIVNEVSLAMNYHDKNEIELEEKDLPEENRNSNERNIKETAVLVDNISENLDGLVQTCESEINDMESPLPSQSTQILSSASLLLCSLSWLIANFFPALSPYRGLFFLLPFFTFILVKSKFSKWESFMNGVSNMKKTIKESDCDESDHALRDSNASEDENTQKEMSIVDAITLYGIPALAWFFSDMLCSSQKEIIFVGCLYFSVRHWARKELGDAILYSDGSTVRPSGGHTRLGTGQLTSRFTVDLKGVLRYIGNKKQENKRSANNNSDRTKSDSEVAVSHIVVKAISFAMEEMSIFNTRRTSIPLLGLEGCFQRKSISASVVTGIHRSSEGSNHTILLKNVDKMSISDIANSLSKNNCIKTSKTKKSLIKMLSAIPNFFISNLISKASVDILTGNEKFGSYVVLTSPNTEESDVAVEVSPCTTLGINMVVVVGGVKVFRGTRGGAIRPMLSMSITIDCPPASIASCRKFSERVQELVQFPEMCDESAE